MLIWLHSFHHYFSYILTQLFSILKVIFHMNFILNTIPFKKMVYYDQNVSKTSFLSSSTNLVMLIWKYVHFVSTDHDSPLRFSIYHFRMLTFHNSKCSKTAVNCIWQQIYGNTFKQGFHFSE